MCHTNVWIIKKISEQSKFNQNSGILCNFSTKESGAREVHATMLVLMPACNEPFKSQDTRQLQTRSGKRKSKTALTRTACCGVNTPQGGLGRAFLPVGKEKPASGLVLMPWPCSPLWGVLCTARNEQHHQRGAEPFQHQEGTLHAHEGPPRVFSCCT